MRDGDGELTESLVARPVELPALVLREAALEPRGNVPGKRGVGGLVGGDAAHGVADPRVLGGVRLVVRDELERARSTAEPFHEAFHGGA